MNTVRPLFQTLLHHMGLIAVVGLLVYVVYNEFVRAPALKADVTAALDLADRAFDDAQVARAEADSATRLMGEARGDNAGLLASIRALLDSTKAIHDQWLTERDALDRRELKLQQGYDAQKKRVADAQKKVR